MHHTGKATGGRLAQQPESRETALRDTISAQLAQFALEGSPALMRTRFAQLVGPGPAGVACRVGGIACMRHGYGSPVVWLHGGGYVFGGAGTHARAARSFARLARMAVCFPSDLLAPEHPWLVPLEDACAVVDAMIEPVSLVGDGAGGQLALAVVRRRPTKITAIALISPNTDRTEQSRTRARNTETDALNSDDDAKRPAAMAMPGVAKDDPDASPIRADLTGLPPTYVTASTNDVLLDDAVLLIATLRQAGVSARGDILPGLWHLWPLWPQADQTLRRIARFMQKNTFAAQCWQ